MHSRLVSVTLFKKVQVLVMDMRNQLEGNWQPAITLYWKIESQIILFRSMMTAQSYRIVV